MTPLFTPPPPPPHPTPPHKDWEWRFGRRISFTHHEETRIEGFGIFDVHLEVDEGRVTKCVVYSDALLTSVVDELPKRLEGLRYQGSEMAKALEALAAEYRDGGQTCGSGSASGGGGADAKGADANAQMSSSAAELVLKLKEWLLSALESDS